MRVGWPSRSSIDSVTNRGSVSRHIVGEPPQHARKVLMRHRQLEFVPFLLGPDPRPSSRRMSCSNRRLCLRAASQSWRPEDGGFPRASRRGALAWRSSGEANLDDDTLLNQPM
jgi:hypothetical protein